MDLDWNRRGIQRLILDAEEAELFLAGVLLEPDPEERAQALRNGRLIYKELVRRRRNYLLTPVAAAAIEQLLERMTVALRNLRMSLTRVA